MRSQCKTCSNQYGAQYKREHRDKVRQHHRNYYWSHREERIAQARGYRGANRVASKKWRQSHLAQARKASREYYAAHREQIQERIMRWHKEHPESHRAADARRRARKLGNGGTHTADDIKRQGQAQKWRCWWCGDNCEEEYHADHLVPLSRGGHNDISNIVVACPTCNLSKHDKMPDEWAGRLL